MAEKFEQGNSLNNEEIEEAKAGIVSSDQSKTEVTKEHFAHFIGKNADKYLLKFKRFSIDGVDKFSAKGGKITIGEETYDQLKVAFGHKKRGKYPSRIKLSRLYAMSC